MSFTATNEANLPNGNLTGNTLTTETYRADAAGLLLQNFDGHDHSNGKGLAVARIQSGLDANKPAGGTSAGVMYIATDTGVVYYDDGTDLDVLATLDNAQTWTATQTFTAAPQIQAGLNFHGATRLIATDDANELDLGANATAIVKLTSAGGVQIGAPTGGDKGAGTINAQAVYVQGTAVAVGAPSNLQFDSGATGLAAGTNYVGGGTLNGTEAAVQTIVPAATTFTKLAATLQTAPGSGNSWTFTLRKNNADTAITFTISNAATVGSDTAHSVAFAANDLISLKVVQGVSAASSIVRSTLSV